MWLWDACYNVRETPNLAKTAEDRKLAKVTQTHAVERKWDKAHEVWWEDVVNASTTAAVVQIEDTDLLDVTNCKQCAWCLTCDMSFPSSSASKRSLRSPILAIRCWSCNLFQVKDVQERDEAARRNGQKRKVLFRPLTWIQKQRRS